MPRSDLHQDHQDLSATAFVPEDGHRDYLVAREDGAWFIRFNGDKYGPYLSEREAMLFAVDAAQKLGEQGEPTQVQLLDENSEAQPVWTYGQDAYPLSF